MLEVEPSVSEAVLQKHSLGAGPLMRPCQTQTAFGRHIVLPNSLCDTCLDTMRTALLLWMIGTKIKQR